MKQSTKEKIEFAGVIIFIVASIIFMGYVETSELI